MDTYEERMKAELKDLTEKVDKLNAFLMTPEFARLYAIDKHLMEAQLGCMDAYKIILTMRVNRLD